MGQMHGREVNPADRKKSGITGPIVRIDLRAPRLESVVGDSWVSLDCSRLSGYECS